MTGNSAPAPRRKIQALTVSVNYADYLECIAANRRHFDRWLVVTDENDTATQEVCRRHGMEILFSKRLYEDGAAFHKAAALNEGLDALDQDAWVAVMDSDILLPHDFRQRLDAQTLDDAGLYGLSGRRVCTTLVEFRALAVCEPWADNLIYTTFVIGYFNLFHLAQKQNRYPEHTSDDASSYDVHFSESFPAAQRHYLPIVCLHAGDTSQNWRGRTSDPFFENGDQLHDTAPDSTAEIAARLGGPGTHAVQIGCYRGGTSRTLAEHFARVTVIDHWGLGARAIAPALAADLAILASRYTAETAGLTNLSPPLEHSAETLAAIPDASLDALWLTNEPEYDFLLDLLPAWLPKLKPGGAIAGGFYDPQLLPGPSRLVEFLIGPPDKTFADMQWCRRIADPAALLARNFPPAPEHAPRGVVYVATDEADVDPLLVSLHTLRRHYAGPVCILCAGDEIPALRLAATRLGIGFRNVPAVSDILPHELLTLHALDWSPFTETIFLECATLVRAPVDWLWNALAGSDHVFCAAGHRLATAAFAWHRSSTITDTWRALAGMMLDDFGTKSVRAALAQMRQDNVLHLHADDTIWSGPAKRAPAGTRIHALPRLARGGALRLYPPWAAAEQAALAEL